MVGMMYPSNLPHPHFSSSGLKQQSNRISTQMASGRKRQRRRFFRVPVEQKLVWKLKAEDAATFLGWVDDALNGGIAWFTLNQRTEIGVVPVDVRMLAHPLEDAKQNAGKFIYTVKCEIRRYPRLSEAQTVANILAPYSLEQFVSEMDMSRYYTESWKDAE